MGYPLHPVFLDQVKKFIDDLSENDQSKIIGSAQAVARGQFKAVYIKHIRGEIREIRVKRYRLLYFTYNDVIYFPSIFLKKTGKTPKKEIEFAEKFYKKITN